VDPGVGTDRRPILLSTPAGAFVAPDNGLLTYVLIAYGVGIPITADPDGETESADGMPSEACVPAGCAAYVLDRDRYWLKPTSATFHGRDIFAPVAAHLATGVRPEELGTQVPTVQCLAIPQAVERGDLIEGRIIHVDRFGNLVSNIRLADASPVAVGIAGTQIRGLSHSYHEGGLEVLALVGSHGYLEIALREGSAAKHLGADVGTRVEVTLR
jgi:S-adenosylmethionine hydrolase